MNGRGDEQHWFGLERERSDAGFGLEQERRGGGFEMEEERAALHLDWNRRGAAVV